MKKTLGLGVVVALALAAVGCGGGGSKTLSKADYASQLNQICSDYNATVKKIGEPNSIAELADKGPKLLEEFDKAVAKADKLKPPSEIKTDAGKFLSESKQLRDAINQLIAAAKKNDTAKITEFGGKADALSKDTDALGKKLGAPACAQG